MRRIVVLISAFVAVLALQAAPALAQQGAGENQYSTDIDEVTLTFELAVEGQPPADTTFFGYIPAEGGFSVQLTDPEGDGVYTGSMDVPQYPPGPRPVPEGVEPVTLPIQIVQATEVKYGTPFSREVIENFGEVLMDEDKTFSASVTFEDPGKPVEPGPTTQEPTTPEPGNDGTTGSGSGSPDGISLLPDTGGFAPTVLGAIALLATAGLAFAGLLSTGLLRRR